MQFLTKRTENRRKLKAVDLFIRPYLYQQFGIDNDCGSLIFEYYAECMEYLYNKLELNRKQHSLTAVEMYLDLPDGIEMYLQWCERRQRLLAELEEYHE